MKEFGSDFHYLPIRESTGLVIGGYFPDALYYACGRQPIIDLYKQNDWKRLWVPEYFCHEVLATMRRNGVNCCYYPDYPLANDREIVLSLPYEAGDALLRVNYFGLRSKRNNDGIPVPVIEDHTHDLIGDWATNSDADWCIASLRKTLPIAEGGLLWSPKGRKLKIVPDALPENSVLASSRWEAMRKKTLFLNDVIEDKNEFRPLFLSTEDHLSELSIASIDEETSNYLERFDVEQWYREKKRNREALKDCCKNISKVLEPEDSSCNPFSLTLLFDSAESRNGFRQYLIDNSVYPAILWHVPDDTTPEIADFSRRMLSIHCDARYNKEEMMQLREIIADSSF